MFESFKNNLKSIAKFLLVFGIVFSALLGFILLVALEDAYKLFGLGVWIFGPIISVMNSAIVYGVALKHEDSNNKIINGSRECNLIEAQNKRLDSIVTLLAKSNRAAQESAKATVVEEPKQSTVFSSAKQETNKFNEELNNALNSFHEDMQSSVFDNVEEIVEEVKEEPIDAVDVSMINVDYKTSINQCVLFHNSLTLPFGSTILLDFVREIQTFENNVFITYMGKTYQIGFPSSLKANEFMENVKNKNF